MTFFSVETGRYPMENNNTHAFSYIHDQSAGGMGFAFRKTQVVVGNYK
jgi:hypothetical protein